MLKNDIVNAPLIINPQQILKPNDTLDIEARTNTAIIKQQILSIFPLLKTNFTINEFYNTFEILSFTSFLSLLNIIIFFVLLLCFSENYYDIPAPILIKYGAKVPRLIMNKGEVWRLFTANFLHLNIFHLFSNLIVLVFLGPLLEKFLGKLNFLLLYLISGISGFFFSTMFSIFTSVGCSGAVFGLFAVYLSFFIVNFQGMKYLVFFKYCFGGFIFSFLVVNLLFSYIYYEIMDHWTHFGGYLIGALLGILMINPCVYSNLQRKLKIIVMVMIITFGLSMIFLIFFNKS